MRRFLDGGAGSFYPTARRVGGRMDGVTVESWANFLIAETGAAAALSGLVFVALSINLARILETPSLPGRAAETLVMMVGAVILCGVGLVPGESLAVLGAQYGAGGLFIWLFLGSRHLRLRHKMAGQHWTKTAVVVVLGQAASLPFVVAGALLMSGHVAGMYWLVPGVTFALIAGVLNAWVLLVEIMR